MQKKLVWIMLILVVLLLQSEWIYAADCDSAFEWEENWKNELLKKKEINEIDRMLRSLLPDTRITFREMVEEFMNPEGAISIPFIETLLKKVLFGIWMKNRPVLRILFVVSILTSIFSNFVGIFQNKQVTTMLFYVSYLLVITICLKSFGQTIEIMEESMERLIVFMRCFSPVFFVGMSAAVGSVSAIAFYNTVILLIYIVEVFLLKIVLPLTHIFMVMQILNYLSEEDMLSKFSGLVKWVVEGLLKALLAFVTGWNLVEGLLRPAMDTVHRNSITKSIEMLPGIGNVAEGTGELIMGVAVLVKNGIGMAGSIILIAISMIPIANMIVVFLGYQMIAAIVQPIAEKRYTNLISSMGDGYRLLLKIEVTTTLLFFITLAVAVKAIG